MQKIVLNSCFGGYGWSNRAIVDYLERKGITNIRLVKTVGSYEYVDIPESLFFNDSVYTYGKTVLVKGKYLDWKYAEPDEWYPFYSRSIDRKDPIGIQLLEEKGSDYCSGEHAKLVIEEYDDENWIAHIDEYDGSEDLELEPLIRRNKIRDCKSTEEVIKYLETFNLFRYDKEITENED